MLRTMDACRGKCCLRIYREMTNKREKTKEMANVTRCMGNNAKESCLDKLSAQMLDRILHLLIPFCTARVLVLSYVPALHVC